MPGNPSLPKYYNCTTGFPDKTFQVWQTWKVWNPKNERSGSVH